MTGPLRVIVQILFFGKTDRGYGWLNPFPPSLIHDFYRKRKPDTFKKFQGSWLFVVLIRLVLLLLGGGLNFFANCNCFSFWINFTARALTELILLIVLLLQAILALRIEHITILWQKFVLITFEAHNIKQLRMCQMPTNVCSFHPYYNSTANTW